MSKQTQISLEDAMSRMDDGLVSQPIFIINNAPVDVDAGPEDEELHRGNTPWLIFIPALNICVEARRKDGEPIVGYFEDTRAVRRAERIWVRCMNDPELLATLQENSSWPIDFTHGHKIMQRYIEVEPLTG